MPNAVFTESGRVGSLYTPRVRTAIFVGNARYQERLGENLRAVGFDATDDGRITAVPEHIREHFSKRTNEGKERARERAEHRGAVWTDLRPEAMAQWIKSSVQHPSQKQRKEGLANFASWAKQAVSLGWQPKTFVAQGPPREPKLYTRRDIILGPSKALMDSLNRLRIESVRTFQRVMHISPSAPSAPRQQVQSRHPSEPWMAESGGFDSLSAKHKASAERSYKEWKTHRNPEVAKKHDLHDYVEYVQGKWAEKSSPQQHPTALAMKREDRGIERGMGRSTVDKTRDVARGYRDVPIRERREPRLTIPL
jgi:hypothetical protein